MNSSNVDVSKYPYWRNRIMWSMLSGYAVFYFIRKNMSVANPLIREEFGIGKEDMGAALGIAAIAYGISKFLSGILADTFSARYVMSAGLLLSAMVSFMLGFASEGSSAFFGLSITGFFAIFWTVNNIFQGMGQPPCSRLLTQWFSPSEIGKQWGIWNMSHHLGAAGILFFGGYMVVYFETWRVVFFAPAVFAFLFALFLMNRLRDQPEDVGLPPIEEYQQIKEHHEIEQTNELKETPREIFVKYILTNKLIWLVSLVNLFIYIVRIGILDWAPSFLKESRGLSIMESAITTSSFEIAGIVGAIAAGWLSDTVFSGRRGRVSVIFMTLLVVSVLAILYVPSNNPYLMSATLFAVGFFVHGPMLLVAVAAADFATKKAAATAVGLTGLFGYIGAFLANYGTGYISEHWGWDYVIYFYLASALIGTLLLLLTWNSRSPVLDNIHS
ncbi:MAG: MFS transporter [Gammaproteobacteria bacterium]|nr:MFS transporter [Gammaproteobacteria bacterium]